MLKFEFFYFRFTWFYAVVEISRVIGEACRMPSTNCCMGPKQGPLGAKNTSKCQAICREFFYGIGVTVLEGRSGQIECPEDYSNSALNQLPAFASANRIAAGLRM